MSVMYVRLSPVDASIPRRKTCQGGWVKGSKANKLNVEVSYIIQTRFKREGSGWSGAFFLLESERGGWAELLRGRVKKRFFWGSSGGGGGGLNRKTGIILLNMRVTMQSVVVIIVSTDPAATVL